ncbi:MAG: transketolase family protein [Candidatus Pacebacteria bacterium]|nr:transketolase family protein [Candidatus Paceibacterota bacterium]
MSKEIYLNPKIFSNTEETEQLSIHQGFDEGLLIAGDNDERVVALCSDPTRSEKVSLFAKEYPGRFFKNDLAEESMFSVALGMATMGKIPFVLLPKLFSPGKNCEQIKAAMYCNNVPVKIIGSHSGVFAGSYKGTLQTIEDIALIRSMSQMTILAPCDAIEAQKATVYAAQIDGPVYIRFPQEETSIITTDETPFEIGKAEVFFRPDGDVDVGVIASGHLVYNAIRAAKDLDDEGVRVRVLNLSTIKPMDIDAVVKLGTQTGKIVIIEECQTVGGVGSAVAEVLAQIAPAKMRFIGACDMSGISDGRMPHPGIDIENIKNTIRELYVQ